MFRNVSRSALPCVALLLFTAFCLAQEPPEAQRGLPPGVQSVDDLSIPQLLTLAERRRAERRFDRAVELLKKVLRRNQADLDALRMLGDIHWETSDVENARKNWLRALTVERSDFGASFGLGRLYLESGQYRQAAHYLRIADGVAPPDRALEVSVALAKARHRAGSGRAAFEAVGKALALAPNDFEAVQVHVALLAEAAREEGGFDRALTEAKRLVQIAGDELQAQGTTLEGVQRLQAAYSAELDVLSRYANVLFERNPDSSLSDRLLPGKERLAASTLSQTVDTLVRQVDVQRTLEYFDIVILAEKAVEYGEGRDPRTLLALGSLQAATGRFGRAAEAYQKVLDIDPGNQTARQQLEALRQQTPTPQTPETPDSAP